MSKTSELLNVVVKGFLHGFCTETHAYVPKVMQLCERYQRTLSAQ